MICVFLLVVVVAGCGGGGGGGGGFTLLRSDCNQGSFANEALVPDVQSLG